MSTNITVLNSQASIVDNVLSQLRDIKVQDQRLEFQSNIEFLGTLLGYEISRGLNYKDTVINTPLSVMSIKTLGDEIVIATILRAGLPVQHGLQRVFGEAELAFIAAGRKPDTSHGVEIDLAYVASNSLDQKVLILADTMLATGHSIVDAVNELTKNHGQPKRIIIASIIASQPGIDYVSQHLQQAEIYTCAVDPELDQKYFIVPGLGDAGDLLYGPKQ